MKETIKGILDAVKEKGKSEEKVDLVKLTEKIVERKKKNLNLDN